MAAERAGAGIVNALVGLGRGLGLTIATEEWRALWQETALLNNGCEWPGTAVGRAGARRGRQNSAASDSTASFYLPLHR